MVGSLCTNDVRKGRPNPGAQPRHTPRHACRCRGQFSWGTCPAIRGNCSGLTKTPEHQLQNRRGPARPFKPAGRFHLRHPPKQGSDSPPASQPRPSGQPQLSPPRGPDPAQAGGQVWLLRGPEGGGVPRRGSLPVPTSQSAERKTHLLPAGAARPGLSLQLHPAATGVPQCNDNMRSAHAQRRHLHDDREGSLMGPGFLPMSFSIQVPPLHFRTRALWRRRGPSPVISLQQTPQEGCTTLRIARPPSPHTWCEQCAQRCPPKAAMGPEGGPGRSQQAVAAACK